ncbi:MAG: tripartite tricarboxylate transporter substrate binding protein, partial [Polaromonas sp.]|nr:tripartite tricarboxylate transporter substrate binding protein [Polaromonas sp.]
KKVNYVAFRGGGEAVARYFGWQCESRWQWLQRICGIYCGRKMRAIGVTSEKRLPGINVPTLKEQGYDVVLGNLAWCLWRAWHYAAQRTALTDIIIKATKSKAWAEVLEKNGWMPAVLTGKAFDDFVDNEFASLRGTMHLAGML